MAAEYVAFEVEYAKSAPLLGAYYVVPRKLLVPSRALLLRSISTEKFINESQIKIVSCLLAWATEPTFISAMISTSFVGTVWGPLPLATKLAATSAKEVVSHWNPVTAVLTIPPEKIPDETTNPRTVWCESLNWFPHRWTTVPTCFVIALCGFNALHPAAFFSCWWWSFCTPGEGSFPSKIGGGIAIHKLVGGVCSSQIVQNKTKGDALEENLQDSPRGTFNTEIISPAKFNHKEN